MKKNLKRNFSVKKQIEKKIFLQKKYRYKINFSPKKKLPTQKDFCGKKFEINFLRKRIGKKIL